MLPLLLLVPLALADEPAAPAPEAGPAPEEAPAPVPTAAPAADDMLKIELIDPKVKGPLAVDVLTGALSASAPLRECMTTLAPVYEGVAMPYWTRAALSLSIEADGHVSKGSFKDTYPSMPAVEACVAKAVGAIPVPAAADGKKTTVSAQLKLTKTKAG